MIIHIYLSLSLFILFISLFFLLGPSACHLCFHQQASEQLQVGVELEINSQMQESSATLAYQVDLPKADLVFRGMYSSMVNCNM